MSQDPRWLHRVNHILEELDKHPDIASLPFLTRASFETLFGLKRRQAIYLMEKMHRYQIGKEFVVDRLALKGWLRKAEIGEKVWLVKRHFVCKRKPIERGDESSSDTPWSGPDKPGSDTWRFLRPSLPWLLFFV